MLDFIQHQFVRGISPNLAAGQRALKTPGNDIYRVLQVPDNPEFYNFGTGPFTIYFRYMDLGKTISYNQTILMGKSGNSTGWELGKQDTVTGKLTFLMKAGGARMGSVADNREFPIDGRFHSVCVTKAVAGSDIGLIRMFLDGIEITGANRNAQGTSGGNFDNSNAVEVCGYNGYFPRGYMDVAAFYTVGLTDAEIAGLDNPATRTDRGAKFIHDVNQLSGGIAYDSSSVGQNGVVYHDDLGKAGRAYVQIEGILSFRKNSILMPPLNGHFTPSVARKVTGIARYDENVTEAQYSLDGVNWVPLLFDGTGQSTNFPSSILIDPNGANPILYTRVTNVEPTWLSALEIQF
jgi:hypothetical protein